MAKKMLIDATHAEETRVVVVDGTKVEDFDFESENKRQLAGNIYLAKVTRVEPSLQAAFVDYGGNRHGFLAFSEIHPDYYQIPVADREALMAEELAYDLSQNDDDPADVPVAETAPDAAAKPRRTRSRRSRGDRNRDGDTAGDADAVPAQSIPGMDVVDFDDDERDDARLDVEDMNDPGIQRVPNGAAAETRAPAEDGADLLDAASPDAADAASPAIADAENIAPAIDAAGDAAEIDGDADPVVETGAADAVSPVPADDAVEPAAEPDLTGPAAGTDDDDTPPGRTMAARHDDGDAVVREDTDALDAVPSRDDDDERPSADNVVGDDVQEIHDDAAADNGIESVADDDSPEDIRPPRKPRLRRYKIQEVIKVRQIMLVQVVKEERGNKGAALTTYLSLAGRYCVLMPNTARGGGISRKITNVQDRKKLKEIATEIDVPRGAGLIIRTAGANRTKPEIRRDYEYLQRLWEQIRDLTLKSVAPAAIYAEGDLIKRSIRDLYNKDIDEVLVEGEAGYRTAKDFMRMIMPSHAKNVKLHAESQPLFARYQVESYLAEMFNPTVRLKSGGYIVIGVTEALVAIDVNSGKSTKEGSIEDTALKTNLEAADEVARQCRLRDLAGLIVIDFIDMDERKNNAAVEKRLKDKLKTDRARIQMGRISGFGLLEMSRQRLRPGMVEATTRACPHCHGTGLVRSDDSLALSILRELEEEGVRNRSGEVLVKAPVAIANYLINEKREHIARIELRYGMAVRVEADVTLISPNFSVEKFKTATRVVRQVHPVISIDMSQMPDDDLLDLEAEEAEDTVPAPAEAVVAEKAPSGDRGASVPGRDEPGKDDPGKPRKKRRRRRRRRAGGEGDGDGADSSGQDTAYDGDDDDAADDDVSAAASEIAVPGSDAASVSSGTPDVAAAPEVDVDVVPDAVAEAPVTDFQPEPAVSEPAAPEPAAPEVAGPGDAHPEAAAEAVYVAEAVVAQDASEALMPDVPADTGQPVAADTGSETSTDTGADTGTTAPDADPKPRKRGWWSAGR